VEHVSVIDEVRIEKTISILHEHGLPVVRVRCAYVHQPGRPKVRPISNLLELVFGKEFDEPGISAPKKS
jgi:hypothetical protein